MPNQAFDARFDLLLEPGAAFQAMPSGRDVAGGDTAGWRRGCDGPVWIAELGVLAFNDIAHKRRLTWAPGSEPLLLHAGTSGASGSARDAQGRFIACETATASVTRLEPDGTVTVIAEDFEGRAFA